MARRITEADARSAARRLADALGHPYGSWEQDNGTRSGYRAIIGGWDLDYNPTYGGCVITEIVNDGGGIRHPLTEARQPLATFCSMVNFTLAALDTKRRDDLFADAYRAR